ncbi:MAG TPA: hypothetical protein QF353_05430 [Gammaproteobacteria bacterium]|nr:hypothetical protein [Gammaproteobacteria bacterium]
MFDNICKLSNIHLEKEDIDKVWPSIEKTLALFDILQEIETDHPKTLDLNITGEHQLRPDQVTLNSPENIDELKHYDPETMSFITPKVID